VVFFDKGNMLGFALPEIGADLLTRLIFHGKQWRI